MSGVSSQARTRGWRSSGLLPRPRLTVVPAVVAKAPRVPFVALVVVVLGVGLVGLLLLNTSLERGAYQVTALRDQAAKLTVRQEGLRMQVAALQDPQLLARKALRLGMVADDSPAFLSLATGKLLGHSVAGAAGDQFDIGALPGRQPDRLGKIPLLAGGVATGATAPVVVPQPRHRTAHPGNGSDTGTSPTHSGAGGGQ